MNFAKFLIFSLLGSLVTTSVSFAADQLEVVQVYNGQGLAAVSVDKPSKYKGSITLLVQGNQCDVDIHSNQGGKLVLKTNSCFDTNVVKAGDKFEISILQSEKAKTASSEDEYKAFSIGMWMNQKLHYDLKISDGTQSESGYADYSLSNSLVFGYEWSQFTQEQWNHGFTIDFTQVAFSSVSVYSPSSGTLSGSIPGKMNIINIAYSGKYRWENGYLPTGIGLSSGSTSGAEGIVKDFSPSLVMWLGFGLAVTPKANFEIISKAIAFNGKPFTSGGLTLTPESGMMSSLEVAGKFRF